MSATAVQVLGIEDGERPAIVAGDGDAVTLVGPHMGARHRTMCMVSLPVGASTIPMCHASEAVWYVSAGSGEVLADGHDGLALVPGAMAHAAEGSRYRLQAGMDAPLRLYGGPSPPDQDFASGEGGKVSGTGEVRVFHRDRPSRRLPMISSDARLVVWPGVGAHTANMNYVRLQPGEENVPHTHPESEDTIVILSGRGSVKDLTNGVTLNFEAGQVIHVPVGLEHQVRADRGSGVESVGGPCPPDLAMLKAVESA